MSKKTSTYRRFPLARRIEHIVMLLSFTTLGFTGLPQKFPTSSISIAIVNLFGNVENLRMVHHIAAVVLMLGTGWHILVAGYKIFVNKEPLTMLPGIKDAIDGIQVILYNLGLRKTFPQMGRYNFEEKIEYWAFVWGTIVMGLTGFMMWNPITTLKILPGEAIPAAKAAHGWEAILAVAAIILWHMYSVHLKRFNKSMFTGNIEEEVMLHEHPLELADLKAGVAGPRVTDPKELRKRKAIYYPVAGILSIIMLAGIYGFVNVEQTALTTIPPVSSTLPAYMPQTPTPRPTLPALPEISGALTWDNLMKPLVSQSCLECHGTRPYGDLSLLTYDDAMRGSNRGPIIIPGNSAESLLVIVQSDGKHYASFNSEDLEKVIQWIDEGAKEK